MIDFVSFELIVGCSLGIEYCNNDVEGVDGWAVIIDLFVFRIVLMNLGEDFENAH